MQQYCIFMCSSFHTHPHLQFPFPRFHGTKVWKCYLENSGNKQFISFKLLTVLSSTMKSPTVPLHPAWDVSHPFSSVSTCTSCVLRTVPVSQCLCSSPLFYLMAPKHKSSNAGNSHMPERSHKVVPLSEKVCTCRRKLYVIMYSLNNIPFHCMDISV